MSKALTAKLGNADLNFEHSLVKVIANRNCPEIRLVGLNVGPYEEGGMYEIQFWIAEELGKAGIIRFREEDCLDAKKIFKIHWTERVQTASQISKLPENFYPKLRRHLSELKKAAVKSPEKLMEYEKSKHVVRDIVNARLKKIVSLATTNVPQSEQILKNLTDEERVIYEQLRDLICEWKSQILEYEERKE